MTLLTSEANRRLPGLHALLVGVGHYPYAPNVEGAEGLGDLSSPHHSVTAMADWLATGLSLKDTPLCSLRVLTSSPGGRDTGWDEPTMQALESAVEEWYDDANAHEKNFALFYFCGHGLLIGSITALLTQSFGSQRRNPFAGTFDPAQFESGMLSCKAGRQLFIIDACSAAPRGMRERYQRIAPNALVQPVEGHGRLGVTKQAEIRASELGTSAYGIPDQPSVFLQSFIKSMKGAGAIKDGVGRWVVKTNSLRTGVDWLVQRSQRAETQLVGFGAVSADFALHELNGLPVVPVKVLCEPAEVLGCSALRTDAGHERLIPAMEPWHLDLQHGHYEFSATNLDTGTVHAVEEHTTPQYTVVSIPCGGTQ